MSVHEVSTQLLPGLDEDIFDYIVSALEEFQSDGDADKDETAAMVSTFLRSAEYLEDEEAALAKATELVERISTGGNVMTESSSDPHKLSDDIKKLVIKTDGVISTSLIDEDTPEFNKNNMAEHQPLSEKDTKLAKKRNERGAKKKGKQKRCGKLSAAELAVQQQTEIDIEMTDARIAAVRARSKLGVYKGALDAKNFILPNPGGGQPLLEDAACRLVWGRRYALIGRNGTGKSTLLRAFAARRVGEVPENVTVHYVSQEVNLTAEQKMKNPVQIVVEADLERTLLLEEQITLDQKAYHGELDATGSHRHGEVLARLDEIDADSAPRRAEALLDNLGFSKELQQRPLSQLSGGWRVRTMLGAALFAKADLLLLDEPTNHLSILAVMWLSRELSTSETWKQRIVVIVSHDRHFLDEVCTDCLHISGAARRLTQSRGNYSLWAKRRQDERDLFDKEQEKRKNEIDKLREYAGHGFKYGGSASQINKMGMKAKQADKLQEDQEEQAEANLALLEDIELPLKISAGGELSGYVVQLFNVGFGYPNSTPARLFEKCDFGITSKTRIVLLGENGNGVSTF